MNISLDDTLNLALAAGYEDARIAIDVDNNVNKDRHSFVVVGKVNIFSPTSPDTLMRLCFELKISVEWFGGFEEWKISADIDTDEDVGWAKTPEQIADAILKCSLQVIKECGE